ncbi:S-(hydroxymethyl)mycothiol dehydrogenase [Brachybacterium sp. EF45031]|uniref:S-(hydroxymethyl)mycothiol dehydrogenase n=1 Tax=Brachybacterium sillae TaxID=2810536 RepID=UPI00217EDBDF|nr:S-(hydroxymethyl)mycothiol dehydrogenase [Brachybacterium sillae]MCS6711108.1 S-(hydroxymethyl)mycothiol dehydrogenase [Brachybacterium sillae]
MSWTVKGVIARAEKQPVEVVDVVVPDPGPHDVIVDVQACGVCHTDLAYRDGGITQDYPFLLGHEAAGRVAVVGDEVTHVEVGDFVVLNWRAVCGQCRACRKGCPEYCFDTHNASRRMTLADGTELEAALGIGAFVERTIVHEGQCTRVNDQADPKVAGLLGCGVMAGLGAAINTAQVQRGESVAVIGLGGVGCAAIAGAKLAGATTIIGLDLEEAKLQAAEDLGATHTLSTKGLERDEIVAKVQELTDGFGADVVIDAVGLPATYETAFAARDLAGRVVLVGVPHPDAELTLPFLEVFSRGGALKSSWYGDCLPERDFPYLTDLFLQGRLPLERFVTGTTDLDGVEAALNGMHDGSVLRTVVTIDTPQEVQA